MSCSQHTPSDEPFPGENVSKMLVSKCSEDETVAEACKLVMHRVIKSGRWDSHASLQQVISVQDSTAPIDQCKVRAYNLRSAASTFLAKSGTALRSFASPRRSLHRINRAPQDQISNTVHGLACGNLVEVAAPVVVS
jgi:hypothetical protein